MTLPETNICFTDPFLDGAEDELGNFRKKLRVFTNKLAQKKLGEAALLNPTDITLTPSAGDQVSYVVRAWHETGGPEQSLGRL